MYAIQLCNDLTYIFVVLRVADIHFKDGPIELSQQLLLHHILSLLADFDVSCRLR
jgi:hypothetical protein